MLKKLAIQNFALIKNLEFIPDEGLNIITGETGAGKTIIVNALSLILGKRSDTTFIRHGEQKLFIEAEFSLKPSIISFLKTNDYFDSINDTSNLLIIRREIFSNGKSRAFINDSPAKLNLLQQLGSLIVDFHGQHDHQSLFNKDLHLHILDRFLGLDLSSYQDQFNNYITLKNRLSSFLRRKKEKNDRIELISFQKKEIEKIKITSDDEDTLLDEELKKLDNIEDIKNSAKKIESIINTNSILSSLDILKEESIKLSEIDENFKKIAQDMESSYLSIEDFNNSADYLARSIEFDEMRYAHLNNRFEEFQKLKKKYGPKLSDVLSYYEEISKELEEGESFDEIISKMNKELILLKNKLFSLAKKISIKRKDGSLEFKKEIEKQFKEVGLKNSEFDVRFFVDNYKDEDPNFQETGIDEIEFYIKTNVGDKFNPLIKTASGGEVSRIMLAIKTITNSKEGVDTLVFDEIDTGISGEISEKVGNKILKLSKMNKQIFAITHIPFIASRGKTHFVVKKKIIANNSTETSLTKISKDQRITEISQMISSSINDSENLRKSAEEMIAKDNCE